MSKSDLVYVAIGIGCGVVSGVTVNTIMETMADDITDSKIKHAWNNKEKGEIEAGNVAMHVGAYFTAITVGSFVGKFFKDLSKNAITTIEEKIK